MNFSVMKRVEMFVKPSEPTPSCSLKLSAIDRVPGLKHMVRSLHVFEEGEEPARVIREALGKALVPYYPFAGRFKAEEGGEAVVECNGEGAWFVEADANCTLEDVRKLDHPLMISEGMLLPDPRPELEPLDIPLMMQGFLSLLLLLFLFLVLLLHHHHLLLALLLHHPLLLLMLLLLLLLLSAAVQEEKEVVVVVVVEECEEVEEEHEDKEEEVEKEAVLLSGGKKFISQLNFNRKIELTEPVQSKLIKK